jgi:hypothetical protein
VFVLIIGQLGTFIRTRPGSEVRTPTWRRAGAAENSGAGRVARSLR